MGSEDRTVYPLRISRRSPSSGWQDLWAIALRATRGRLHCYKTLTDSCLLSTQPGWSPWGGSRWRSTLKELESFLLKHLCPPLDGELGVGETRMDLGSSGGHCSPFFIPLGPG